MKTLQLAGVLFLLSTSATHAADGKISILKSVAPANDLNMQVYHADEVADVRDKDVWTAIIKDAKSGKYQTKKVKITVEEAKDIGDAPGESPLLTGRKIFSADLSQQERDDMVFLMKGPATPANGEEIESYEIHQTTPAVKDEAFQTKSWEIKGRKGTLRLVSQGNIMAGENVANPDYRLLARVGKSEVTVFSAEDASKAGDGYELSVTWAGDLNKDGLPDFVLEGEYYNASDLQLFLSHAEGGKVAYEKAASRQSTGC